MLYPAKSFARRSGASGTDLAGPRSYRSHFDRDYARILHSPAFRRLAGKTQLFPSHENDFFRNRLTHSLEVAQVARTVASRLNRVVPEYRKHAIDPRLCELAALAHDIGHPPFGHNGEESLHSLMNGKGGFEGNAQTLRIVGRLEKKEFSGVDEKGLLQIQNGRASDRRMGLDLCARSLAAVLKYDAMISPQESPNPSVQKGFYYDDCDLVDFLKENVGDSDSGAFKTIECSIMDISDDIAYSTYDLEDAFKGGFLNPLRMMAADTDFKNDVAKTVRQRSARYYPELKKRWESFSASDIDAILMDVFDRVFEVPVPNEADFDALGFESQVAYVSTFAHKESRLWADNGYFRVALTSKLIARFVEGVKIHKTGENPIFWNARLNFDDFLCVETLKTYAFKSLIMSSFLRVSEYRGHDIIAEIFGALSDENGTLMMPTDCRSLCESVGDSPIRNRVICDFIASMTDRYAVEFYNRINGSNAPSIFKPH